MAGSTVGHVARMSNDRRAKQVITWCRGGGNRRRPRKNWPETIGEDLKGLFDVEECSRRGRRRMDGGNASPDVQFSTGRTKADEEIS